MAVLHLMVGLPCSGKTTRARQLEKACNALRLTTDVWHLALYGSDVESPEPDARHSRVEQLMWDVAKRALELGVSVILDFGCWTRVERDDFRRRAQALGVQFQIHYMEAPREELLRRLRQRNQCAPEGVFVIPESEMLRYMEIFQPPSPEELLPL